jgi:hypothetical protein
MGDFLFYGLDHEGDVKGSERWAGISRTEAEQLASERLANYEVVELWEGSIRVLTVTRDM